MVKSAQSSPPSAKKKEREKKREMMGKSCERSMDGDGITWPRRDYGPNRLDAPFLPFPLGLDAHVQLEQPSFQRAIIPPH